MKKKKKFNFQSNNMEISFLIHIFKAYQNLQNWQDLSPEAVNLVHIFQR
jgi:hypothetical protein